MNMAKVGQLIADKRLQLGLTQAELAKRLDITDKAISKWERGKSLPDISLLNRLAAELRVSVLELLAGEANAASRSSNIQPEPVPSAEAYAEPVSLTLDPAGDVFVSPYLFGTNMEHTRANIHRGLSAQMLKNRKFVGKPASACGCAAEWYPIGEKVHFTFAAPYTRHDEKYHMHRVLECNSLNVFNQAESTAGIGQHELPVRAGRSYEFAIVAKTKKPVTVTVALTSRHGRIQYSAQEITVDAPEWTRYEAVFTPDTTDDDADLRITFGERAGLCIGAVSLLPDNHFRGMRRDVIECLREIGFSILRWPGGNFAGEYNWLDGLMPVDMRAPFESTLGLETQPHSMGYDFHEINTDDFIALCREVGAEPFITINPCWNTAEESAAWVEYCNGDETTEYGRMRIERGYAEPYNVQLWSLGNEFGYGHMEGDNTPEGYCRIALENGRKMLEKSPCLTLCSSGPYPNEQWIMRAAHQLTPVSQMISQHYYGHEPRYADDTVTGQEYYTCLASIAHMRNLIHETRRMLDDKIKISFDEWNIWYAWYRPSSVSDGVYAALGMHLLISEAEPSGIAMACHFESVNEGTIIVTPDSAHLTAQGQILAMMKRHSGGRLLHASRDTVATLAADGAVTATFVNASLDAGKPVGYAGCGRCTEAKLYTSEDILPPSYFEVKDVLAQAQEGKMNLPPHSVLMLKFEN